MRIVVDIVVLSRNKKAKQIVLASSDFDLLPAISEVKQRKISCIYLGFESKPNKGLYYTTDRTILIRNSELCQYEKTQPTLLQNN